MPSIRIGFSTDFNLTGEQIGIGTTNPTARLDVAGQIRSDDSASSGGVSTVTRYAGFLDEAQGLGNNVSIAETTKGNLNSLSGEIKISGEVTVTEDTKLTGGRLDSLTVTGKFDLPHGGSEDREDTPEKGSTRFNQDLGQLEFYTGYEWRTVNSYADSGGRGRAVIGGGYDGAAMSGMEFFTMATLGNTQNFGDLTQARLQHGSCASATRGLWQGGSQVPVSTTSDRIDYCTIASAGNAIDFGNLPTATDQRHGGFSSSTRGFSHGGLTPAHSNVIDYIEISTVGNALDFGDMTEVNFDSGACASPTRGIICGGVGPDSFYNLQNFVTMSSKGNATDFGDLAIGSRAPMFASNSVRGIFGGGNHPSVDYRSETVFYTLSSLGNATYFGELTIPIRNAKGVASQTRVFSVCGNITPSSARTNSIEYFTISTAGNAIDFGDASEPGQQRATCSDSHGGLGGF
jgi:hypothetical protein